jgi:hypothetical protein
MTAALFVRLTGTDPESKAILGDGHEASGSCFDAPQIRADSWILFRRDRTFASAGSLQPHPDRLHTSWCLAGESMCSPSFPSPLADTDSLVA